MKCWNDASANFKLLEEKSDYDRYIKERSCTPEEQAGEKATFCKACKRKCVHENAHCCMNADCDENKPIFLKDLPFLINK